MAIMTVNDKAREGAMSDRTAWIEAGAWLKQCRLAAEITQAELAEQVGAPDPSWIAEIEAGTRSVPVSFHAGYARAVAMPVAAFAARCEGFYGLDRRKIDVAA